MRELRVELTDRTLRFDGVSVLQPAQVEAALRRGLTPAQVRVTALTPELDAFNALVAPTEQLRLDAAEPVTFDFTWQLPPQYLALDVEQHVLGAFEARLPGLAYDATLTEAAITRVALELEEYRARGLFDLLRVIVYVLDRLRETNQLYGVGRGSSCASYVLFLLGLHAVDAVRHAVPLEEFFHD